MFTIESEHYFIGMIRCQWADRDCLFFLYKKAPTADDPEPWRMYMRMRTYKDNKVFNSSDEKQELRMEDPLNLSEQAIWGRTLEAVKAMMERFPRGKIQVIPIHGSGTAMGEGLFAQPWAHCATPGIALTDEAQFSEN